MRKHTALLIGVALSLAVSRVEWVEGRDRPNVVFIMTDNHGAWTLGCYGNPDIRTPNIDRLSSEGLRFTRALSSNPVCSPTRATYLTGLLPSQHGVHSFLGGRDGAQIGPDAYCTIAEFATLPKTLAAAGYTCGLSGKWHLGANLTPQEGFTAWTTMPHGGTSTFFNAEVVENGEVRKEPKYTTEYWTERAVSFIESNKDKPFFLFLSYNGPYALSKMLLEPSHNRHASYYADKLLPSFPREPMNPWQYHNKEYLNNPVSIRNVAAEVSGVDDGVGRVMEAIDRLGLDDDTLVVFCADQGWLGGQHGLWGMGDHTRPIGAFEGMMQVPLIFHHRGKIAAGTTSDHLVSNYDFMPSLVDYLGVTVPASDHKSKVVSPGRSYAPTLRGQSQPWDEVIYYEMETCRAIRTNDWKYVRRFPDGPDELYDMKHDADERHNLADASEQSSQKARLADQLAAFFDKYADPKYDVYHGGASKAKMISHPELKPGDRIDGGKN